MTQPDPDDPPNLTSGTPCAEAEVVDPANCIRLNQPIEEIANFLFRSRREIWEKVRELGRTGDLPRLFDKTAAHADTGISIEGCCAVSAKLARCGRGLKQERRWPANSKLMITEAERRFPCRIKLGVTAGGFGTRLTEMQACLDENCGADGWAITPAERRGVINDSVAIHFATPPQRRHS
jgi:hypothetical protein